MPGPVAILIPTMRAHLIPALIRNIEATTPSEHSVYWACTRESDCEKALEGQKCFPDDGGSWPVRINALFKVSTEPYIFLGADDVVFHPEWLEKAFDCMEKVEGVGVVSVNDLNNPYGTLSLISREYVDVYGGTMDRSGPVIHPGYHHNWCDTELRQTAEHRGRFIYCEHSVVEHMHHDNGKAPFDEVYALGDKHLQADVNLFFSRHPLWM
jgi:hypothetical protein